MTALPFTRNHSLINIVNIVLSLGIVVMTLTLVLLFSLAPASSPPYELESQHLKVLRYSQAD